MRFKWYAIMTTDRRRIIEAVCFSYEQTPLGAAEVVALDKKWSKVKKITTTCMTDAQPSMIGQVIRNAPASRLFLRPRKPTT